MDVGAEDPEAPAQGWFVDPFGVHEHRWYSQGRATALVRDGRTERQDPAPFREATGPLVAAQGAPPPGRVRWIALVGSVVWSILIAIVFFGATTTKTVGVPGHVHTETVYAFSPGAAVYLFVLLAVVCAVSGVSLVRRVRQGSGEWSRAGCVCVGVIALVGIYSLKSIGLALVVLALLLYVVARPLGKVVPMAGDRIAGP
ncbi:MAG: hypothetical protein ABSB09_02865 [Acidimicrobiales bacterium]|jgi:hypothetical protein